MQERGGKLDAPGGASALLIRGSQVRVLPRRTTESGTSEGGEGPVERPAQPVCSNRLFDAVYAAPHQGLIYTNSWSGIHPSIVAHSVAAS